MNRSQDGMKTVGGLARLAFARKVPAWNNRDPKRERHMTSEREDRIRAKAHEIWLSEGEPEGSETRHWDMATAAIEAEDAEAAMPTPSEAEPPTETSTENTGETSESPSADAPDGTAGEAAGEASQAPESKPAPKKRAPRARKTAAAGTATDSDAPAAPRKRATRARKTTPSA